MGEKVIICLNLLKKRVTFTDKDSNSVIFTDIIVGRGINYRLNVVLETSNSVSLCRFIKNHIIY